MCCAAVVERPTGDILWRWVHIYWRILQRGDSERCKFLISRDSRALESLSHLNFPLKHMLPMASRICRSKLMLRRWLKILHKGIHHVDHVLPYRGVSIISIKCSLFLEGVACCIYKTLFLLCIPLFIAHLPPFCATCILFAALPAGFSKPERSKTCTPIKIGRKDCCKCGVTFRMRQSF